MTVSHSDCFCDSCMIKYFKEGLIPEGTPAYNEVIELLNNKKYDKITKKQIKGNI